MTQQKCIGNDHSNCSDALSFSVPILHTINGLYSYLLLELQYNPYRLSMNIAVLPVMLSSKLLPEMEVEETTKREQLLSGITNLPVPTQIEKLKVTNLV